MISSQFRHWTVTATESIGIEGMAGIQTRDFASKTGLAAVTGLSAGE
jgi:hypothetical protein